MITSTETLTRKLLQLYLSLKRVAIRLKTVSLIRKACHCVKRSAHTTPSRFHRSNHLPDRARARQIRLPSVLPTIHRAALSDQSQECGEKGCTVMMPTRPGAWLRYTLDRVARSTKKSTASVLLWNASTARLSPWGLNARIFVMAALLQSQHPDLYPHQSTHASAPPRSTGPGR